MRNLVQNAVDFASDNVWVDVNWDEQDVILTISDDGPGFSPQVINRIGDPFVRKRGKSSSSRRPGYEGMGLGLFIAKTLLERSGAEISFANGSEPGQESDDFDIRSGAIVQARWSRERLGALSNAERLPLGENIQFDPT